MLDHWDGFFEAQHHTSVPVEQLNFTVSAHQDGTLVYVIRIAPGGADLRSRIADMLADALTPALKERGV